MSWVAFAGWVVTLPRAIVLPENSASYVVQFGGTALSWVVCGAGLVWLRPRNAVGWLLLLFGSSQAWQLGAAAYGSYGTAVADPSWPAARWVAFAGTAFFVPTVYGPPTVLLAYYPDGRLAARWWRWPVAGAVISMAVGMAAVTLMPEGYVDMAPGERIPVVVSSQALQVVFYGVSLPLLAVSAVIIWVGTVLRLVRSGSPQRQQLAVLTLVVMPFLATTFISERASTIVGLLIPVAVAVGVLRYGMLGIVVVLRRSLVYAALTATIVLVYLIVATAAGSALNHDQGPAVLAAAVAAVGLVPARDRLQRAVDRLVYGERANPLRAATRLADQVADAPERDLLPAALRTIVDVVRTPGVELIALDGRVLARIGVEAVHGKDIPLRITGHDVGTLRVANRGKHDAYTADDGRLMAVLAPHVAAIIRALDLAHALQVERDRVVAATRVERDRLRRDLHDGLGPALAGIGLGLQALQDSLHQGELAASTALVDRINAETTSSVVEVRRLIDGLRPVAVDELGLLGAVRRHARMSSMCVPVDVIGTDLPPPAPEVETTAYRITTEALTNVVRHARAARARVTLTADAQALTVVITDDGTGLVQASEGVGLASMRRRAAQLNGHLSIESGSAGTTIRATLPLEAS